MFLLGLNLPPRKRVSFAIRRFKGIGPFLADVLCGKAHIHPQCKVEDLKEVQTSALRELIQDKLEAERQLTLARMKASKRMQMAKSSM